MNNQSNPLGYTTTGSLVSNSNPRAMYQQIVCSPTGGAIQEAIDRLDNTTGGVVRLTDVVYRITEPIRLKNTHNITFKGIAFKTQIQVAASLNRPAFVLDNSRNIAFDSILVQGPHHDVAPSSTFVQVDNSSYIRLSKIRFEGFATVLEHSSSNPLNLVDQCTHVSDGRFLCALGTSDGAAITIKRCIFYEPVLGSIYVRESGPNTAVNIKECVFKGPGPSYNGTVRTTIVVGDPGVENKDSDRSDSSAEVLVRDCSFSNSTAPSIEVNPSYKGRVDIFQCVFARPKADTHVVVRSERVSTHFCDFSKTLRFPVRFEYASKCEIENSHFDYSSNGCVSVIQSKWVTIQQCKIRGIGPSPLIFVSSSDYTTIIGSTFECLCPKNQTKSISVNGSRYGVYMNNRFIRLGGGYSSDPESTFTTYQGNIAYETLELTDDQLDEFTREFLKVY